MHFLREKFAFFIVFLYICIVFIIVNKAYMKKGDIIIAAIEKYGDKYDYSLVEDACSMDNISIICKEHGIFNKRLCRFLNGSGCPKCSGKARKTNEEFIKESNNVHGGKYDYSRVKYVNSKTKVCIVCPEHGEFWQAPTNHLSGNGCPMCKFSKLSDLFSSNIDEFKKKGKMVHNSKYTYDKSVYKNNFTPILITCPIHGDFYQVPHNHLQGKGCPKCNESHLERELTNALDESGIDYTYQWHLPWAKRYSLDFFIPSVNMGIECQGVQHFEDGHFNCTLEETNERDKYKFNSCKEHGIDIVYFSNIENDMCITNKDDVIKLIKNGQKREIH